MRRRIIGLSLVWLWGAVCLLPAADYLWTASGNREAPDWIRQLPPHASMIGETRFEIVNPQRPDLALAVTVFFQEQSGGFLRVLWGKKGVQQAMTLNLYEGVEMENRRTLLLKPDPDAVSCELTLQSFHAETGIQRAYFQWIEPTEVYQPASADPIVLIDEYGDLFRERDAAGWPAALPKDEWEGEVTIAPLTERPERIEGGVAYLFELVEEPDLARIAVEVAGLPPGDVCRLWLNGVEVGLLQPEVPSLTDPGYEKNAQTGEWSWTGWRGASLILPPDLLVTGENELILEVPADENGVRAPVAVKDLILELNYPGTGGAEVVPQAVPAIWNEPAGEQGFAGGEEIDSRSLQFLPPRLELKE